MNEINSLLHYKRRKGGQSSAYQIENNNTAWCIEPNWLRIGFGSLVFGFCKTRTYAAGICSKTEDRRPKPTERIQNWKTLQRKAFCLSSQRPSV